MIDVPKLKETLAKGSKEEIAVALDKFVDSVTELVTAFSDMKKEVEKLRVTEKDIENLAQTAIDLKETIRNIYMVINENDPVRVETMKDELAKFVLGIGVTTNAK